MVNYFYDAYTILNKVYSEKSYVKQAISSTFIEEKNRAKTVKTVYGVLDKDIELSYYIKKLSQKNPKLVIRTILKIALYNIKYLQKAEYAVINSAVELTKKLGKGAMSGFVNAFLRKFVANPPTLPLEKIEKLSVVYSYPPFAVKKLIKDYGEETAIKIMAYENEVSYLAFLNGNGVDYLNEKSVKYENTVFDNLYVVKNFVRDDGFDKGSYTFQNVCSYAICDAVKGGNCLIDVCSAPGGKSVNLSYKFNKVVSLDIHEHRIELVKSYANRLKRDNITAIVHDSTTVKEEFIDAFDACLCDAPCSGFGVVSENPDIKFNREELDIKNLTELQVNILKASSNYVKKGGYLYYSACSVFNDENRKTVDKFLSENKNFIEEEVITKHPHLKNGKAVQFLPHISGGGFFLAKLKRID